VTAWFAACLCVGRVGDAIGLMLNYKKSNGGLNRELADFIVPKSLRKGIQGREIGISRVIESDGGQALNDQLLFATLMILLTVA